MDERLDSMGAQIAGIDLRVSLGASIEELHGYPTQLRLSKATQYLPMHNHLISFAFALVYLCLVFNHPLLNSF